ncbi:MAG: hypothetical protein O3B09_01970 [Proteobacteria bacterium]|nr:hypothetical protein [Pseudomonadota bacterium]
MKKYFEKSFLFNFGFIALFSVMILFANDVLASLTVAPTRVEFEGRQRTSEVKLINKANVTTTYRISLQHLRMKDDGSYEQIEEGEANGEKFVDDIIRYSPRRVTLKPKEIQIIRLMIRKPKGMEAGEYRSHMLFQEEADPSFGADIEKKKGSGDGKIQIVLKPLFGISIPIIVKHGDISASAELEVAELRTEKTADGEDKILTVNVKRSGNGSIFGNIIATFKPDGSDQEYEVGFMSGVSALYPYKNRMVSARLDLTKVKNFKGTLNITLYGREKGTSNTDRENVIAKTSYKVN